MDAEELKRRTKQYSLRIIPVAEAIPNSRTGAVIGDQLLRSGLSVGANYRAACRGRSKPDIASKVGIAIEEADETLYWMDLLIEAGLMPEERLRDLIQEANERIAIFTASMKTIRRNQKEATK